MKLIHLWLILGAVAIFSIAYFAPTEEYKSDVGLTLLTSQAIVEHQTLYLDWYKDAYRTDTAIEKRYYVNFDTDRRIVRNKGHYYHYSIGTGIFSVPFVWVANLMGQNMVIPEHEFATQNFISALSCAFTFLILYYICQSYVNSTASLVISTLSVLGSSLISILGGALWNLNFTVVFNSLALLHLTRYETGKIKSINPYWLGFLIFSAYLCRPTAAFFGIAVFIYLFFRDRKLFLRINALALLFLLVLVAFTWLWYGELLPVYYSPVKILPNLSSAWLVGFYGNLLSPSRGLFTFSPFLILVLGVSIWFFPKMRQYPLFWMCIFWFGLHITAVSTRPNWWGGHTYGPRFSTDIIPAFVLMTALAWREISRLAGPSAQRILSASYIALGILGIFIHSYQGLYNPYTKQWNKHPNVDNYNQKYLLSWAYPQFLASKESLARRNLERYQDELSVYALGNAITHEGEPITFVDNAYIGPKAILWDWHKAEADWRWSAGALPRLVFKLGPIDFNQTYTVEILATSLVAQEVAVSLNQAEVGRLKLDAFTGAVPNAHKLVFNGNLLQANGLNEISFRLPNTLISTDWNARTAGLAFVSLKIYPAAADNKTIQYFESEFFQAGFSDAETGWRWTDGTVAKMIYPLEAVETGKAYTMQISAGAFGVQKVEVRLNGARLGELTFEGFEPQTHSLTFSADLLEQNSANQIHFFLPNATIPEGDSRKLGLAFVNLEIYPVE